MIRDPSDGTVREKPVFKTDTSGLPIDKLKADEIQRLERARDWLKNYFNRTSEQTKTGLRSTESGEG